MPRLHVTLIGCGLVSVLVFNVWNKHWTVHVWVRDRFSKIQVPTGTVCGRVICCLRGTEQTLVYKNIRKWVRAWVWVKVKRDLGVRYGLPAVRTTIRTHWHSVRRQLGFILFFNLNLH